MTSTGDFDALVALGRRLEAERARIVGLLLAAPEGAALDEGLLRQLAVIQGACQAVGAEIEARTPALGRGGET
jgi:hypothetical protein